jgi:hypothetical protein
VYTKLQGSKSTKPFVGTGPALYFAHHLISLIKTSKEWAEAHPGEQTFEGVGSGTEVVGSAPSDEGRMLKFGLIPTAVGGTSIDAWVPGAPLFEHMLVQVSSKDCL